MSAGEPRGGAEGRARVDFLYAGQSLWEIPRDVTHVRVDPSVRKIGDVAFQYRGRLEELELREGVKDVGAYAFLFCGSLRRVRIPTTVARIGAGAFDSCERLEEAELPDGLREVGDAAFHNCGSVRRVRIPPSAKRIGPRAFAYCRQLEEVELCRGLKEVGCGMFQYCQSLKRVRTPPTVKRIGYDAFSSCERLQEVELGEGLEFIDKNAFRKCKSLRIVALPSTLKVLGKGTFENCSQLERVDICEGLKQIGEFAFNNCSSLRWISIPSSVKKIGQGAFNACHRLASVELNEGLEEIQCYTFADCKSLRYVKLPSTIKKIGREAFKQCIRLVTVDVGNGLEQVGELAFKNCFSLRNIAVPATAAAPDVFEGCHDIRKLFGAQSEVFHAVSRRLEDLPVHRLCYYQSHYDHAGLPLVRLKRKLSHADLRVSFSAELSPAGKEGGRKRAANWSESGPNTKAMCRRAASSGAASERAAESSQISHSSSSMYNAIDHSQDCLGMTPLHILACSTKQRLDLYQLIVAHKPECLITKDKWGHTPIFYAIWGSALSEIVEFLIDGQKSAFPDIDLDWDAMVSTLCRAGAPLDVIRTMLAIQKSSFPDQNINFQRVGRELTIRCLVGCDHGCESFGDFFLSNWESTIEALANSCAYQNIMQSLLETEQMFFPDRGNIRWQAMCEDFVKPLKGWWRPDGASFEPFQFLVRCSISERIDAIRIREWQRDIKYSFETSLYQNDLHEEAMVATKYDDLHSMLVLYECKYHQLEEAMFLLELALWKFKIGETILMRPNNALQRDEPQKNTADTKRQCRVNSGAHVVIPNVLPYLIADARKDNMSGADSDVSVDSSSEEDMPESSSDEGDISSADGYAGENSSSEEDMHECSSDEGDISSAGGYVVVNSSSEEDMLEGSSDEGEIISISSDDIDGNA